jgi:perosamine synthetase
MAISANHVAEQPVHVGTLPIFRPDITEEEIAAVAAAMRSGWIGPGPRVVEFERQFALAMRVDHAVSVASGTAALQAALAVLGIGPGDEIIMPSFTWVSLFQVVIGLGATPVFADIEPDHLTIDPDAVRRLITRRTKGVVAVHHGGQLADVEALRAVAADYGVWLIDDAAHACGSAFRGRPVGSLGTMTAFSFNAMKNLVIGDGGMVTTMDAELARRLRLYRSLGIDRDTYSRYGNHAAERTVPWRYDVVTAGQRLHMNDIAAAIGLVQLRRLAEMNGSRGRLVARYEEQLSGIPWLRPVHPRPGTTPSHHMFTVRMPERDAFIDAMSQRGIAVGVHYIPIHLFEIARRFHRSLPVTEEVWRQVTTFPLFPAMTEPEQDRVIAAARASCRRSQRRLHEISRWSCEEDRCQKS